VISGVQYASSLSIIAPFLPSSACLGQGDMMGSLAASACNEVGEKEKKRKEKKKTDSKKNQI
jgi:hypothetical protein